MNKLFNYLIAYAYEIKPSYRPWPQLDKTAIKSFKIYSRVQPEEKDLIKPLTANLPKAKNLRILSITHINDRIHKPIEKNILNMELLNLGFDELVDTSADIIEVAMDVVKAGEDGWHLSDSLVLIPNIGKIQEIIKDAPTALAQLKDLDEIEAGLAAEALSERLNADPGTILEKVDQAFDLLSRIYILYKDTVYFAKGLKSVEA